MLGKPSLKRNPRALHFKKEVNGSPCKWGLLWVRFNSGTVCRLLRTGQANVHQPLRRSLPDETSLQRWWRDFFFFCLFCIDTQISQFCCRLSLDFSFFFLMRICLYMCNLSLLCSVFYIVNMYNCPFFVPWNKIFRYNDTSVSILALSGKTA